MATVFLGLFGRIVRGIIHTIVIGTIILTIGGIWLAYDLPFTKISFSKKPSVSFLDCQGKLFATFGDFHAGNVTVDELPAFLPAAILAVEDHRFYTHQGIDSKALLRAVWVNCKKGSIVQGGSTITQQLAKNLLQNHGFYQPQERFFKRKFQEIILSLWIEKQFSKKQILSLYLNSMYFGAGAFGINAAAYRYFNKSATEVTLEEALLLAALLKAPSKLNLLNHYDQACKRAAMIKGLMIKYHFPLPSKTSLIFPLLNNLPSSQYFADWVFENLTEMGWGGRENLIVFTTFNPSHQTKAEASMQSVGFPSQGALVCMTKKGAITAMVGGIDYNKSQFNRVTQAYRQMGSTFKMVVYLAALEKGIMPDTLLEDTPLQEKWSPKNYLWKTRGVISMEESFIYSVNTATVRLAQKVGLKKILMLAKRLGIVNKQPQNFTVTLGSGTATLLELTHSYAVIANEGKALWPFGIEKIYNDRGEILYHRIGKSTGQLVSVETATHMRKMLEKVVRYGTGKKAYLGLDSAGKSGTTQNHTDAWFIGFNGEYVVGVWIGHDLPKAMPGVTGGSMPALIWKKFMQSVSTY